MSALTLAVTMITDAASDDAGGAWLTTGQTIVAIADMSDARIEAIVSEVYPMTGDEARAEYVASLPDVYRPTARALLGVL